MKKLISLSLISTFALFSFTASAAPSFPRDLKCVTKNGSEVTLKSNNSLWANHPRTNHAVTLDVEAESNMDAVWTNNKAKHTRGNDTGIREYIFDSVTGESFFITLEFHAPFGQATGIKNFSVRSKNLQFSHSSPSLNSATCNVQFHARIEI